MDIMLNDRWSKLLFSAVLLACMYHIGTVNAAALRHGRRRTGRNRADPDRPYYWMCPEVLCPELPEDCETIEYIVFQYDYEVRGRVVNVRCESCEYCLDGPPSLFPRGSATRRRRTTRRLESLRSSVNTAVNVQCPEMHCPSLPDDCRDERLTDILVDDVICKRCPACYDSTVFNDGA